MAFCTDVSDDNGERIGSIGGGVGSVTVSVRDEHFFMMRHDNVWYAFQEALEKGEWHYPENWGEHAKEEE